MNKPTTAYTTILAAWLASLRASGRVGTDAEALCVLNDALGTRYTLSRLYAWRAGTRSTPRHVARYCATHGGVRQVLDDSGPMTSITDRQVEAVTESLT